MAWVAGANVITGDIITYNMWNDYNGATGSMEYVKSQTDLLFTATHSEPARVLDTIYQNSTKIRIVTINVRIDTTNDRVAVLIEDATPPTIRVFTLRAMSAVVTAWLAGTFIVPPNWYYRLEEIGGDVTLQDWHEWDLF